MDKSAYNHTAFRQKWCCVRFHVMGEACGVHCILPVSKNGLLSKEIGSFEKLEPFLINSLLVKMHFLPKNFCKFTKLVTFLYL